MTDSHVTPAEIAPLGATQPATPPERGPLYPLIVGVSTVAVLLSTVVVSVKLLLLACEPEPNTVYILHPETDNILLRAMLGDHVRILGPWQIGGSVAAPDGRVYANLESSFLQGQTLAIGRDEGDGWLYHSYQTVGETNGDAPRLWIPLVRPAGVNDGQPGQIYCSDSGIVVGLRYENHCYMAYDTLSERFFGHPSNDGPGEKITAISPFLLIGPDTELHQPDVARIQKVAADQRPACEGVISTAALQQALAHSNPAVRQLAQRLLGATAQGDSTAEGDGNAE
jgi:hypothetical protein